MLPYAFLVAGLALVLWASSNAGSLSAGSISVAASTAFRSPGLRVGLFISLLGLALLPGPPWVRIALVAAGVVPVADLALDYAKPDRSRYDISRELHYPSESRRIKAEIGAIGLLLERFRLLWVAALLPCFVLGEGKFLVLGLVGVAVLWGVTGFTSGVLRRTGFPHLPVIVLLCLLPVTVMVTPDRSLTTEHLGYFLAQLLTLYSVVTWCRTAARVSIVTWVLVATGCMLAAATPLVMEGSSHLIPALGGLSIQKNVLGGSLAVLALLPIALLFGALQLRGSRAAAALTGACSAVMLSGLAYTQSRGAWLALGVALVVMLCFLVRPARFVALGACAVSLLAAITGALGPLVDRLLQADGDLAVRSEIWSRAAQLISDFPLTGSGMGSFRVVVPRLYPYLVSDHSRVHHAHNLYLQVASDLGLPGLAAFLALLVALLTVAFGACRACRLPGVGVPGMLRWVALGSTAGLCALLGQGLVDAVTWTTRPAFLSWAVLGLVVASGLTYEQKQQTRTEVVSYDISL